MARGFERRSLLWPVLWLAGASLAGCADRGPPLSRSEDDVGTGSVPAADGPQLGVTAHVLPVRERPSREAAVIGYLHAGARVARAAEPLSGEGCELGFYPIRPRGFVCLGDGATLEMSHPTLRAMAMQPTLDRDLPYTYARTRRKTALYERDASREDSVREIGTLPSRSTLAVVGSWTAKDASRTEQRLALLTNGQFARTGDLAAAEPSAFKGQELSDGQALPLAFVVKRGVRSFRVEDDVVDKLERLSYHEVLKLTGRYRTLRPIQYWAVQDGRYVRHRDVTVIRERHLYPDFASADQKWIDVSIITGTLVLYEGKKPVFATLVSVGRDRMGDPATSASTEQGTFEIVTKHVTAAAADPRRFAEGAAVYDAPWALELSNGQFIHGAPWHDRFGIEHGPGSLQLSVADARYVWQWVEPGLPEGWHGVTTKAHSGVSAAKTLVVVRK